MSTLTFQKFNTWNYKLLFIDIRYILNYLKILKKDYVEVTLMIFTLDHSPEEISGLLFHLNLKFTPEVS